ncbi:MAG: phage tail protein [Leptothrix sp. (in: b-proteobacteria)]
MAYTTIHTTYGLNQLAIAEANGTPINLINFALGDGGGFDTTPVVGQTSLVREVYRVAINRVYVDPASPGRILIEGVVPAATGGFTIREFGIFDDHGQLSVVGNFPPTYKTLPSDGATNDLVVRVEVVVSNVSVINLVIDPAVAVASQAWVVSNITFAALVPGGTTGQVLRKRSNTNGDVEWATQGVTNILVNTIEETQSVASGQLTFTLGLTTTLGLSVFVEGVRLPKVTGAEGWQQGTGNTQVVLGKQYAVGSRVTFLQNEPAGQIGNPLQKALNLSDLDNVITARNNLDVFSRAESVTLSPAGTVAYFAGAAAPVGWLLCNGAIVSSASYPNLFSVIGTTYGAAVSGFRVPDLRGLFIRGVDAGRGVDSGRALGSYQDDAIQNITGSLSIISGGSGSSGAFANTGAPSINHITANISGLDSPIDFNASRVVRTSFETRVKNLAMLPIIKY